LQHIPGAAALILASCCGARVLQTHVLEALGDTGTTAEEEMIVFNLAAPSLCQALQPGPVLWRNGHACTAQFAEEGAMLDSDSVTFSGTFVPSQPLSASPDQTNILEHGFWRASGTWQCFSVFLGAVSVRATSNSGDRPAFPPLLHFGVNRRQVIIGAEL
jgi:hypothetical protein